MGNLGCFSLDGDYSLRSFNVLPQFRSEIGTKFIFYHLNHSYTEYSFSENDKVSLVSELDDTKGLVVVIHGWFSSRNGNVIKVWCTYYHYFIFYLRLYLVVVEHML